MGLQLGLLLLSILTALLIYHCTWLWTLYACRRSQFTAIDGRCYCGINESSEPNGFKNRSVDRFAYIRSMEGGQSFKVYEDLSDPQEAANTMHRLSVTASTLIDKLVKRYDAAGLQTIKPEYRRIVKSGLDSLKKNFDAANLEENIPQRSGGDTSYVVDKGEVFAMCLRDPKNNNQLETKMNNLIFVLVHELAHIFTSTYGHDTLFWNNFKFLLEHAVEFGLYEPVDYRKTGSPYCGIVVTYSPLYDASLKDYRLSA